MSDPSSPPTSRVARTGDDPRGRGAALLEFALVLPMVLILLLGTIDFGHLIQTRLIITNVSREGGSIGSRSRAIDPNFTNLLLASGKPLDLGGADGRVFVTRIKAGQDAANPNPTVETQLTQGSLAVTSKINAQLPTLGLSPTLHGRLVFDPDQDAPDIPDLTVVEVLYKYRPITPLSNLIPGILRSSGDGMIIQSRAIF